MNDTALKAWLENHGFPSSDSLQQTLHGRIANATTPLMHAARMGRIGYIGELLSRGADPREMNADGNGALWFACYAGSAPARTPCSRPARRSTAGTSTAPPR